MCHFVLPRFIFSKKFFNNIFLWINNFSKSTKFITTTLLYYIIQVCNSCIYTTTGMATRKTHTDWNIRTNLLVLGLPHYASQPNTTML